MKDKTRFRSILSLFIFLIPLLAIALILTSALQRIQYPDKPPIPTNTEILILGDSHAACGLDPDIIGMAANFSSPGESYLHNYYKLKWCLKRGYPLKTILLPLDLHSFSDFRKDRIFFNLDWLRYLDYLELGWIKKQTLDFTLKYLDLRLFGFKGKYRQFIDRIFKTGKKTGAGSGDSTGFSPKEGYFFHSRPEKSRKRAGRQLKDFDVFNREMIFWFKRILNRCRDEQIRVILIRMPISGDYYDQAGQMTDVAGLESRMLSLAQVFPGAMVLDFRNIYFGQESGLFVDPQHLNAAGARDLSTRLRRRLVQLRIIE